MKLADRLTEWLLIATVDALLVIAAVVLWLTGERDGEDDNL